MIRSKDAKQAEKNLAEAVRNFIAKLHFEEDSTIARELLSSQAIQAREAGVDVEKTVRAQRHFANAAFSAFDGEAPRVIESIVRLATQGENPTASASSGNGHVAPAGWYPDPGTGSGLRWWDGLRWTEHRHGAVSPPQQ